MKRRRTKDALSSPHIVISGWYGQQNIGDDAMLEVLLRQIQHRFPQCRFTILSEAPEVVKSSFGDRFPVHCLAHPSIYGAKKLLDCDRTAATFRVWRAVRAADLFILGGGSLVRDHNPSNFLRLMDELLVARLAGVPAALLGVSVGPLRTRWGGYLTRVLLGAAFLVTVRDQESRDLLSSVGVSGPKVRVAGDLALLLPPHGNPGSDQRCGVVICPCTAMLNGLPDGPRGNANLIRILADFCLSIHSLLSEPITIVPFRKNVAGDDDLSLAMEIARASKLGPELRIAADLGVQDTSMLLGRSRLVVGARFHSLVFAAAQGVPVIGIAYGQKINRFLNSLGLDDFAVRPVEVTRDRLIGLSHRCLNNEQYDATATLVRLRSAERKVSSAFDVLATEIAQPSGGIRGDEQNSQPR